MGPKKKKFSLGGQVLIALPNNTMIVGAGDGEVSIMEQGTFKIIRSVQLVGGVTSMALNAAGDHFFVGTNLCNVYLVSIKTLEFGMSASHDGCC